MRKAGRQTPGAHRAPRLQAGGAAGRWGAAAPARPPAPPVPPPPPTASLRAPGPGARPRSRDPQPAPPARPCPGRLRPRSAGEGRGAWRAGGRAGVRGRRPGKAASGGPQPPPRSPPPPRRGRERRTHPGDAMSAARSRRCRRLRFLRAERLRRGGASHRPPAARPGSSRRRGRGEGPGSAGDGCEWARSRGRVRPGIGSERAGRWRLGEGARGRPGAAWGRWGRGRHGAGTGDGGGPRPAARTRPPAQVPRCPQAGTRREAPSVPHQPRNCPGATKQLQDPGEVTTSLRYEFDFLKKSLFFSSGGRGVIISKQNDNFAVSYLVCYLARVAGLSEPVTHRKRCVRSHCEALRTVEALFIILYIILATNNNESVIPAVGFTASAMGT